MFATRNDIPEPQRRSVSAILNERLADVLDLAMQAKQAHWNVKGPNFIALHELFDQVYAELLAATDDIAERVVALGGVAEGTVAAVAKQSHLPTYPLNIATGAEHIDALATSLAAFGKAVRRDIDRTAELGDADTADLFTGLSRALDKQLWFLEAHRQSPA